MMQRCKVRELACRTFIGGSFHHTPLSKFKNYGPIVEAGVSILRQELDVPETTVVVLDKISDETSVAYYMFDAKMCVIDPRRLGMIHNNPYRALTLLLSHEFVHAEQYHTKRLRQEVVGEDFRFFWEGTIQPLEIITNDLYLKAPWEVEAWGRQDALADLLMKR